MTETNIWMESARLLYQMGISVSRDMTEYGKLTLSTLESIKMIGGDDPVTIIFLAKAMNLPLTKSLDQLILNYKQKYYTPECLSYHHPSLCLISAAIHSNVEVFKASLSKSSQITPFILRQALMIAVENSDIEISKIILNHDSEIFQPQSHFTYFSIALEKLNDRELMLLFISYGYWIDLTRYIKSSKDVELLRYAKNRNILQINYTGDPEIDRIILGPRNASIVDELIKGNDDLHGYDISVLDIVCLAIRYNHLGIIRSFHALDYHFTLIFPMAIESDNLDVLRESIKHLSPYAKCDKLISNYHKMNPSFRQYVFSKVLKFNNFVLLDKMLDYLFITQELEKCKIIMQKQKGCCTERKIDLANLAVKNGFTEMLKILLPPIEEITSEKDNTEMSNYILTTSDIMSGFLSYTVKDIEISIVNRLLDLNPSLDVFLLKHAASFSRFDIIDLLIDRGMKDLRPAFEYVTGDVRKISCILDRTYLGYDPNQLLLYSASKNDKEGCDIAFLHGANDFNRAIKIEKNCISLFCYVEKTVSGVLTPYRWTIEYPGN